MRVPALGRVEGIEAVAEGSCGIVRDERVLPSPARSVHGVVRVEIDQRTESVRRRAVPRRAEAVDRLAAIRVAAEQILEAAVVDPGHAGLDLRDRARPVGDLEPVGAARVVPRREAEVGQRLRPALRRPVRAVRRRARGDDVREARVRRTRRSCPGRSSSTASGTCPSRRRSRGGTSPGAFPRPGAARSRRPRRARASRRRPCGTSAASRPSRSPRSARRRRCGRSAGTPRRRPPVRAQRGRRPRR